MKIRDNEFYHLIFWSGSINDPRLRLTTCVASENVAVVDFYNTLVFDCKWNTIYCCPSAEQCEVYIARSSSFQFTNFSIFFLLCCIQQVVQFEYVQSETGVAWQQIKSLPRYVDDEKEQLLQLKLDKEDTMLLGSTGKGFVVWDFSERLPNEAIYLALPHGVRNITTKMMTSNSFMVSATLNYAVAGVR